MFSDEQSMLRLLTRTLFNTRWSSSRSLSTADSHVDVKIIDRDEKHFDVKAKVGTNMLDVILDNKIDVDGFGACEGTLACSTCHVILDSENYKSLPEPVDEENDMLDLAFGLTPTSRLACQIVLEPRMKGWVFVVPKVSSRMRRDFLSSFVDSSLGRQRSTVIKIKISRSNLRFFCLSFDNRKMCSSFLSAENIDRVVLFNHHWLSF